MITSATDPAPSIDLLEVQLAPLASSRIVPPALDSIVTIIPFDIVLLSESAVVAP